VDNVEVLVYTDMYFYSVVPRLPSWPGAPLGLATGFVLVSLGAEINVASMIVRRFKAISFCLTRVLTVSYAKSSA
jgi:hypothetical protein